MMGKNILSRSLDGGPPIIRMHNIGCSVLAVGKSIVKGKIFPLAQHRVSAKMVMVMGSVPRSTRTTVLAALQLFGIRKIY
jgi:hypothetical protein